MLTQHLLLSSNKRSYIRNDKNDNWLPLHCSTVNDSKYAASLQLMPEHSCVHVLHRRLIHIRISHLKLQMETNTWLPRQHLQFFPEDHTAKYTRKYIDDRLFCEMDWSDSLELAQLPLAYMGVPHSARVTNGITRVIHNTYHAMHIHLYKWNYTSDIYTGFKTQLKVHLQVWKKINNVALYHGNHYELAFKLTQKVLK